MDVIILLVCAEALRINLNITTKKQVNSLETDDGESSEELRHDFMLSVDSNSCEDTRIFLVELPLSVDGNDFHKLSFQVDTAASCNTLPNRVYESIGAPENLTKSKSVLHSYSGNIIKAVGKHKLLCECQEKFDAIEFEIIDNGHTRNVGLEGLCRAWTNSL